MPPVNIPITQVWPSGLTNTSGTEWITASGSNLLGIDDPQPIDSNIGILFNSGTQIGVTEFNTITLYLRGSEGVPVLESTLQDATVGLLNGYSLSDNDNLPSVLQTPQTPNDFNIQATLEWGVFDLEKGYQITLQNNINPISYSYNSITSLSVLNVSFLSDNTNYLFYIELSDNTINASIYPVNAYSYLESPIFVTGPIKDSSVFYRTPGRLGINVNMQGANAKVLSLRPYKTIFAAFESNTFNSITPVIGAQLYAQNTPPTQLFSPPLIGITSSDSVTPTITNDSGRTLSGESYKVAFGNSAATTTLQGITTQPLTPIGDNISGITDHTIINTSFDIWVESSATNNTSTSFTGLLINSEGYGIELTLPDIVPNKWSHVNISLLINSNETKTIITENINTLLSSPITIYSLIPSGLYTFGILYSGEVATTIWLDNIQITSDAVNWYGRSTTESPYTQNLMSWIPFNSTINSNNDGIRFAQQGTSLQVKAEAFQQDAEIYNGYTLVPKYAQLGRYVGAQQTPSIIPESDISLSFMSLGDNAYQFTCEIIQTVGSPIYNSNIFNITWSFGDGNYAFDQWIDGEPNVSRIYTYSLEYSYTTQYYITVNVIDENGNKGYNTIMVTL